MKHSTFPIVLAALIGLLLGCETEAETSIEELQDELSQNDRAISPEPEAARPGPGLEHGKGNWKHHGHRGHRGLMLLGTALTELDLTDAQRAEIQALRTKAPASKSVDRQEARAAFRNALARAVQTGDFDESAFEDQMPDRDNLREERMKARAEHLATLHQVLTAEQRKTLVGKVRSRLENKAEWTKNKAEWMKNKGEWAKNKAEWRGKKGGCQGDCAGCPNRADGKRGFRDHRGHRGFLLGRLVQDLDLTEDQRAQLAALWEKHKEQRMQGRADKEKWAQRHEEMKAHTTALLDAFQADSFDPGQLELAPPRPENAGDWRKARMERLSEMIQILTQDQRDQLAEKLRNPQVEIDE